MTIRGRAANATGGPIRLAATHLIRRLLGRDRLNAIGRVWQACFRQPRLWCWLLAACALLTGGFHYRLLPASQIVTRFGTPVAALAVAMGCFLVFWFAASLWLMWRPEESETRVAEKTSLSLCFASMLCVWACIGPIGGTFFAHGRFVRLAIWFASFTTLQIAWLLRWDERLKARLPQLWREKQPISWTDAILAAGLAVFAAETLTYFDRPYIQVTPFALVMNIALLASAMIVAWAILGRGLLAVGLTAAAYFTLSFANAMKLKHLYAGIQPGDQSYLGELIYFKEFFQPKPLLLLAAVVLLALGCFAWAWKKSTRRLSWPTRGGMLAGGLAAFVAVGALPWLPWFHPVLHHLGIIEETWDSYMSVKRNGLLVELAMQLPESYVPRPANYNAEQVARALRQGPAPGARRDSDPQTPRAVSDPPSLVVFFFEALTNPEDFHRPLTRDVTPHFNALRAVGPHGYAITPRLANGSAEAEFELITGMSSGFLPPNSCAYKHFMKRPTPSLATMLRRQFGYRSTAVKCVTPGFYNFQEAYEHFEFDRFCYDLEFVAPRYDKFSGHMADDAFVDEMLRPLEQPPAFVVGENLGSHAPYQPHLMGDKPRFLVEPSNPACDQLETYFQAISRTDDALGRMVELLRQRRDRVVLLVVGDHHPPLAADSHAYDFPEFQAAGASGELFRRRVPFVIWKNFTDDEQASSPANAQTSSGAASAENYISMNFLALLMLREAGIEPTGLIAWCQTLYELCPVVSRDLFFRDGRAQTREELPRDVQQLVQDYELLQYDILLGENYAEQYWAEAAPEPRPETAAESAAR